MKSDRVAKAAKQGAKLVVLYGPQAKILWDKGGKQATAAALKRAQTFSLRRKALAHGVGLVDGSVLKIAPAGTTMYVVFSGDQPIATYPPQQLPYAVLLEHADLSKRIPAEVKPKRSPRKSRNKSKAKSESKAVARVHGAPTEL
jgi:hypothetical protein